MTVTLCLWMQEPPALGCSHNTKPPRSGNYEISISNWVRLSHHCRRTLIQSHHSLWKVNRAEALHQAHDFINAASGQVKLWLAHWIREDSEPRFPHAAEPGAHSGVGINWIIPGPSYNSPSLPGSASNENYYQTKIQTEHWVAYFRGS